MVNRNNGRYICEAIESVIAQDYQFWTLSIVDDSSTDGSWELIEKYRRQDSRIKSVQLLNNCGIPAARNIGLATLSTDYVATLDSDDIWLPDKLSKQVIFMEADANAAVGVCGGHAYVINESGQIFGLKQFPTNTADCVRALWYRNPFCNSATLIRRKCFVKCGTYDAAFEVAQDFELWLRLGAVFKLANIDAYVVKYRYWHSNVTQLRFRAVVANTFKARFQAVRRGWYGFGILQAASLPCTWLVQWFPVNLVCRLFFRLFVTARSLSSIEQEAVASRGGAELE